MGARISVQLPPHEQLVPQSPPVAAVAATFCSAAPVVFQVTHQSTIPSRFIVRDPASGVVCFRKERKLLSSRQTLVDVRGSDSKVAVLNAKKSAFRSNFTVRPENADSGDKLFEMNASVDYDTAALRVAFVNLVTRKRCLVGFEGNWRLHNGLFWLQRGPKETHQPVGKVWQIDSEQGTYVYSLEIAPNVDVALVLAICMVLDERWRRFKSANDL